MSAAALLPASKVHPEVSPLRHIRKSVTEARLSLDSAHTHAHTHILYIHTGIWIYLHKCICMHFPAVAQGVNVVVVQKVEHVLYFAIVLQTRK